MKVLNFYDPAFIKTYRNLRISPGKVEKYPGNPLFKEGCFDNPPLFWEVRYDNGYPNVFFDPYYKKYRCYYTAVVVDETSLNTPLSDRADTVYKARGERVTALLYAESIDGIIWEKPKLGIVELGGSKDNNILMLYAHGSCVFLDPNESDPKKKYKLIARDDHFPRKLCTAYSGDGIHFSHLRRIPEHAYSMPGDTHNYVTWDSDRGKYILLTRMFSRELRTVGRSESTDFINWTPAVEVFKGNGKDDQIYAMPYFKEDDMYIGLPAVFHEGDKDLSHNDCVDIELAFSGDSLHWERIGAGIPFIPRGKGSYPSGECDCGCCFASPPVLKGDEYLFYYMGGNGKHYSWRETGLCLATAKRGRLAGLRVVDENKPGEVCTVLMQLNGSGLYLNGDFGDCSKVRMKILDKSREVIEGYDYENLSLRKAGDRFEVRSDGKPFGLILKEFYLHIEFEKGMLFSICGDIDTHPIHPVY